MPVAPDPEPHASLDDDQLTRAHHELPELRLDVKAALLGQDQEVAIVVAERLLVHGRVRDVHVDGKALAERRVAVARHRLEAIDEVDFAGRWDLGRMPGLLGRRVVGARVQSREVILKLCAKDRLVCCLVAMREVILTSGLSGSFVKPW